MLVKLVGAVLQMRSYISARSVLVILVLNLKYISAFSKIEYHVKVIDLFIS